MSSETDKDQYSQIHQLRAELHQHEKGCAEWRGGMNVKVNAILWLLGTCTVAFAAAGATHYLPKLFGG